MHAHNLSRDKHADLVTSLGSWIKMTKYEQHTHGIASIH